MLILVLICIAVFLGYSQYLTQKADMVARDRVLSEIRQAMAMLLYDYAVQGKLEQLQKLDRENPFTLMAAYRALPKNYKGAVSAPASVLEPGWYFNLATRQVIWRSRDDKQLSYALEFEYEDMNHNHRFDPASDAVIGLQIKKPLDQARGF